MIFITSHRSGSDNDVECPTNPKSQFPSIRWRRSMAFLMMNFFKWKSLGKTLAITSRTPVQNPASSCKWRNETLSNLITPSSWYLRPHFVILLNHEKSTTFVRVANRREALVRIMMWSRTALLALIWFSLILYREKKPQINHGSRSKLDATVVLQKTTVCCIFRRSSKLWLKCDVNSPVALLLLCVIYQTFQSLSIHWLS